MELKDLSPQKDIKGGASRGGFSEFDMTKGEAAVVSLKEYFDVRLEEMDRRLMDAQNNSKEAVKVANAAQERRLDLLNEFRGQASDESKKYALKDNVDAIRTQVSMLYGGVVVVGIIGVANLVKLFFGN